MKPLLASAIENVQTLRYPLLVSPKLDGVRCLIFGGKPVSRNLKIIPNKHVQNILGNSHLEGLDGELIVGSPNDPNVFNKTTSGVMSMDGSPDFKYYVFDNYIDGGTSRFHERFTFLQRKFVDHPHIEIVPHDHVTSSDQLNEMEAHYVNLGYEGVMLRDPNALYKQGRSTLREGILLKMKRFEDDEAVIEGFVEQLHNDNEAKVNALGLTERSSHKANMVAAGTLGALQVRSTKFREPFQIGSGFTAAQRSEIWNNKDVYINRLVKYKFQPSGVLDLPRFPIFLGFRLD